MEKTTQKTRKSWSADDKISVIRKHMQKSKMVDTCEENRVHPTMLSAWIKTVLEAGREALAGSNKKEFREKKKLISFRSKLSGKKRESENRSDISKFLLRKVSAVEPVFL